jgi:Uma2 family endonuclease
MVGRTDFLMDQFQETAKLYTYGDLENFPENETWELIDGIPYLQAEPSITHQYISDRLIIHLVSYLEGKPCQAFSRIPVWPEGKPQNKRAHGYLVPDLLIVCDPQKIHEWGVSGAPDLVVEIVSPSNASNDKITKLNKYREIGVKTYWIVEPEYRNVEVYSLDENGHYRMTSHNETLSFADLEIRLEKIFPPLPNEKS